VSGLAGALWAAARDPLVRRLRRSNSYELMLGGPMPDRLRFTPVNPFPGSPGRANELFRGRWRFGPELADTGGASPFDATGTGRQWQQSLHQFGWLKDFGAHGGDMAERACRALVKDWVNRFSQRDGLAWEPETIARRLIHWVLYPRFVFEGGDLVQRSEALLSLARQARYLARIAKSAKPGQCPFAIAAALILTGLALPDGAGLLVQGQERMDEALAAHILPDGGLSERRPDRLLAVMADLILVKEALIATEADKPVSIQHAIDKIAPMLRLLRLGDGKLTTLACSGEGPDGLVDLVLARSESKSRAPIQARHTGFGRLATKRTIILADTGTPPPGALGINAPAGLLGFEMSTRQQRIIVSVGPGALFGGDWAAAAGRGAAFSTLTINDRSAFSWRETGLFTTLLGRRPLSRPQTDFERTENDGDQFLEGDHDGWAARFGVVHRRRIFLTQDGEDCRGEDILERAPRAKRIAEGAEVSLRFHLHPDLKAELAQDRASAHLVLPSGEGWRFRATGGPVKIEDSVYLGDGVHMRRNRQLVVSGTLRGDGTAFKWGLKKA